MEFEKNIDKLIDDLQEKDKLDRLTSMSTYVKFLLENKIERENYPQRIFLAQILNRLKVRKPIKIYLDDYSELFNLKLMEFFEGDSDELIEAMIDINKSIRESTDIRSEIENFNQKYIINSNEDGIEEISKDFEDVHCLKLDWDGSFSTGYRPDIQEEEEEEESLNASEYFNLLIKKKVDFNQKTDSEELKNLIEKNNSYSALLNSNSFLLDDHNYMREVLSHTTKDEVRDYLNRSHTEQRVRTAISARKDIRGIIGRLDEYTLKDMLLISELDEKLYLSMLKRLKKLGGGRALSSSHILKMEHISLNSRLELLVEFNLVSKNDVLELCKTKKELFEFSAKITDDTLFNSTIIDLINKFDLNIKEINKYFEFDDLSLYEILAIKNQEVRSHYFNNLDFETKSSDLARWYFLNKEDLLNNLDQVAQNVLDLSKDACDFILHLGSEKHKAIMLDKILKASTKENLESVVKDYFEFLDEENREFLALKCLDEMTPGKFKKVEHLLMDYLPDEKKLPIYKKLAKTVSGAKSVVLRCADKKIRMTAIKKYFSSADYKLSHVIENISIEELHEASKHLGSSFAANLVRLDSDKFSSFFEYLDFDEDLLIFAKTNTTAQKRVLEFLKNKEEIPLKKEKILEFSFESEFYKKNLSKFAKFSKLEKRELANKYCEKGILLFNTKLKDLDKDKAIIYSYRYLDFSEISSEYLEQDIILEHLLEAKLDNSTDLCDYVISLNLEKEDFKESSWKGSEYIDIFKNSSDYKSHIFSNYHVVKYEICNFSDWRESILEEVSRDQIIEVLNKFDLWKSASKNDDLIEKFDLSDEIIRSILGHRNGGDYTSLASFDTEYLVKLVSSALNSRWSELIVALFNKTDLDIVSAFEEHIQGQDDIEFIIEAAKSTVGSIHRLKFFNFFKTQFDMSNLFDQAYEDVKKSRNDRNDVFLLENPQNAIKKINSIFNSRFESQADFERVVSVYKKILKGDEEKLNIAILSNISSLQRYVGEAGLTLIKKGILGDEKLLSKYLRDEQIEQSLFVSILSIAPERLIIKHIDIIAKKIKDMGIYTSFYDNNTLIQAQLIRSGHGQYKYFGDSSRLVVRYSFLNRHSYGDPVATFEDGELIVDENFVDMREAIQKEISDLFELDNIHGIYNFQTREFISKEGKLFELKNIQLEAQNEKDQDLIEALDAFSVKRELPAVTRVEFGNGIGVRNIVLINAEKLGKSSEMENRRKLILENSKRKIEDLQNNFDELIGMISKDSPFGVEVEYSSKINREEIAKRANDNLKAKTITAFDDYFSSSGINWDLKYDGSIYGSYSAELVSPKLYGEEGLAELEKVLKAVNSLSADEEILNSSVEKNCGIHVHHDISDLLKLENSKRLINRTLYKIQAPLYAICHRGRSDNGYCSKIGVRNGEITNNGRSGFNFSRYGTLEFRMKEGSMDIPGIIRWVKLTKRIVETIRESMKKGIESLKEDLDTIVSIIDVEKAMQIQAGDSSYMSDEEYTQALEFYNITKEAA